MSKQIFKTVLDKDILIKFLDKLAEKKDNYYLLTNNSYKKVRDNKELDTFLDNIKNTYHKEYHIYI